MNQKPMMVLSVLTSVLTAGVTAPSAFAVGNSDGAAFGSRLVQSSVESLKTSTTDLTHALGGHIPRSIKAMIDHGSTDTAQVLPVTIALQLNNEDDLNARIEAMYRPGSPTYHQFITPGEFVAHYAPTDAQIQNEKAFLESQGITVQDVSENHMFLHASGTIASLNAAFKTEVHTFARANGKEYFAPAYDLQAPVNSRITNVIGMSNTAVLHPHFHMSNASPAAQEGSAPGGGVAPADIRTAYNLPSNLDGSGQTLALFELEGYKAANITAYEKQFKLPATPLKNVLLDGFNGKPTSGGEAEVELDIELMIAVAPKVKQILVYEGPNSSAGLIDTYAKIASDNLAKQVSSSWGQSEIDAAAADMQSENKIFKQMVAQGQSLFSASGDSGAEDSQSQPSALAVDDPSGQPYVIGVGGTKLVFDSHAKWQSETTWNELTAQEGAGGGGISSVWTIPSWQAGTIKNDTQSSKTMRNVPDVSLNADPVTGYGIYFSDPDSGSTKAQWAPIGGTSAAAPIWAAFNALVNQNRVAKGLTPTGFLNPALYAVGASSKAAKDFNDIADGSNNGTTAGNFKSFKGYDNATGWGSFQGTSLLNDLSVQ